MLFVAKIIFQWYSNNGISLSVIVAFLEYFYERRITMTYKVKNIQYRIQLDTDKKYFHCF